MKMRSNAEFTAKLRELAIDMARHTFEVFTCKGADQDEARFLAASRKREFSVLCDLVKVANVGGRPALVQHLHDEQRRSKRLALRNDGEALYESQERVRLIRWALGL